MRVVEVFPLASIKSDEHLAAAQEVMDRLLAEGELDDDGEETYLDGLSDLVAACEDILAGSGPPSLARGTRTAVVERDAMKRPVHLTLVVGLLLVVAFAGCSSNSRPEPSATTAQSEQPKASTETDHAKAIAEIENCGGQVVTDKEHPGQVWVWFDGSKVTDAGLVHLNDLRQIRMLVLDSTDVTDAGLVNLEGLTTLYWLALNKTRVTDAGLVHLKGLVHLEELQLAHTTVTDAGLVHLEGLTMLQGLDLHQTQVTDAGLVHLKGLTKLRSLDLGGTKVTYVGGVKGLQKALSNCTILFGSPAHARVPHKWSDDESLVRLLVVEAVQKDLGLTADQIEKIRSSVRSSQTRWREFNAKLHEILPPGQSFPSEEAATRQRKEQTLSEDYKREGKEMRTKLLAMLTADQNERLKQIELQTAVAAALARPEIIHALQISEEQGKKIDVLKDRLSDKFSPPDLRHLNSKERRQKTIDFMKESDKASAATNRLVLDVLTPEQRAKFEKLRGKKIEVNWPYDELLPEDFTF